MACNEQSYELITEVVAYPDGAVVFNRPFQEFKKYVTAEEYTVDEEKGIKVPLAKKSGKLKESSSENLHGTEYTVTLSWEVNRPTASDYDALTALKKKFKHLIIKYFGGSRMMVRSMEDGYLFTAEENEGVIACELSVKNACGAQRIL